MSLHEQTPSHNEHDALTWVEAAIEVGYESGNVLLLDYCEQLIEQNDRRVPEHLRTKQQMLNELSLPRWLDVPLDNIDDKTVITPQDLLVGKINRVIQQVRSIRSGDALMCYVLVPAFNEESYITALINSLKGQDTVNPLALIVADNNSTDETAGIVSHMGGNVVHASKQGVGPARQHAVESVIASIQHPEHCVLIQTDADCIADRNYVHSVVKAFLENPNMQIGIGPSVYTIPLADGSNEVLESGKRHGELLGTKGLRGYFEALGRDAKDYLIEPPFRYLVGPNTTFRASVFTNSELHYPSDRRWETLDMSIRYQQLNPSKLTIQYVDGQRMHVSPRAIVGEAPFLTDERIDAIRQAGYVAMHKSDGTDETPYQTAARVIHEIDADLYELTDEELVHAIVDKRTTLPEGMRATQALHASTKRPIPNKIAIIAKQSVVYTPESQVVTAE